MMIIHENKNTAIERLPWHTQTTCPNHIALHAGKKQPRLTEVGALARVFETPATKLKIKQKLLKCKRTIQIETFNFRTLKRIGQISEQTPSAIDHNIDIICIQEHGYIHSKHNKYPITGNGWTLLSPSAWKNSANTTIEGVGILIGSRVLKSLNSIEKIQLRMMVVTFNGNPMQQSPVRALSMLVKKLTYSLTVKSYPPLFVTLGNATFSSSVETWIPKLVKT